MEILIYNFPVKKDFEINCISKSLFLYIYSVKLFSFKISTTNLQSFLILSNHLPLFI